MHAMAEWYMRGEQYDQAKLSRILDVAQDLKVSLEGQTNTLFIFDKTYIVFLHNIDVLGIIHM